MESKFIPTLQVGNGYTYLKLKGILDEDNLLANLLSQIQGRLLLIEMSEIERINSCGVRDWVNWLNQIQALGVSVILLKCSPVVVAQANMVANFAADAFIHSFYAPYVHPDTGDEQNVLLFTEDLRQNKVMHAPKIFNENGEELEFDEFEESYFAFISDPRIMNYQIPADIQAVIQYYLPEAATHQPVIASAQGSSAAVSNANYASSAPQQSPSGGWPGGFAQQPQSNGYNNMGMPSSSGYGASPLPQAQGYGMQGYGDANASPMSAAPINSGGMQENSASIPQPVQPVRHNQPPIPQASAFQKVPPRQPRQQPPRVPVPSPANNFPPPQNAPAPQPPAEPQPAPAPVSSLELQARERAEQHPSVPEMPTAANDPRSASMDGVQVPFRQGTMMVPQKGVINASNSRKKLILFIGIAAVAIVIIAVVLLVIILKK